jgi:hypothetical protein
MFNSEILDKGQVLLPEFGGVRIMMMPFHVHDARGSLPPSLARWVPTIERLCELCPSHGTGYVTIDEALVRAGETHRRPGLHVDGVGPAGVGSWAAEPGPWGGPGGMLIAASHLGCRAWSQAVDGELRPNGDCAHMADKLDASAVVPMLAGRAYWLGPYCVHEALPMPVDTRRQVVRVSMPSTAPWYEGYTVNPLGIPPGGPIHAARAEFMAYRSGDGNAG